MILRVLEVLFGLFCTGLVLKDVFDTVVVPGSVQGWLNVAQRVRKVSHPSWHRPGKPRQRMSHGFAPFLLLTSFAAWMILLLFAIALAFFGMRESFAPPLRDYGEAVYVAGVSLVTFGLGGTMVSGPARWLILAAGFFGMGVITLSITYILQVQNALQRRDSGVMKLTTTAGRPPTGIELLETYAELGCRAELGELFREWRNWSNAVLYSHAAHPVLAYFRSVSANIDWPTAAEVALDAASLLLAFVDEKNIGQAALLHRDGSRLAAVMARIFEVELKDAPAVTPAAVAVLRDRLSAAGYPLKPEKDAADIFTQLRSDYAGRLAALAKHVGAATAELLPD